MIVNMRSLCVIAGIAIVFGSSASAETATYVEPDFIDSASLNALSTASDNAGATLNLGQTLGLVYDQPFATSRGGSVSIFTVAPASGFTFFSIRFGSYNNGSPLFTNARGFVRAGNTAQFNNLFQRGCRAFGGCDYIEITNVFSRGNPTGAEVDYVEVDGEVTVVTPPTPEPSTWAMMILGFWFAAGRLKKMRLHPDFHLDRAGSRYASAGMTQQ